jgi:hypothetical protein
MSTRGGDVEERPFVGLVAQLKLLRMRIQQRPERVGVAATSGVEELLILTGLRQTSH